MTRIVPVTKTEQIKCLCKLANEIWHETYDPLLPPGQTAYMLEKFQSPDAVTAQIETQNYHYFLLQKDQLAVGFIGVVPNCEKAGEMLLSKIYLLSAFRGQGIVRAAFRFLKKFAAENSIAKIWLTVNKQNQHAQDVYRHYGFQTAKAVKTAIGNGYFMDDYIMECATDAEK